MENCALNRLLLKISDDWHLFNMARLYGYYRISYTTGITILIPMVLLNFQLRFIWYKSTEHDRIDQNGLCDGTWRTLLKYSSV